MLQYPNEEKSRDPAFQPKEIEAEFIFSNASLADSAVDSEIASNNVDKSNALTPVESPITEVSQRFFQLEPAIFCVYLATSFSSAVFQNQVLYQACIADFHFNEITCKPLLGVSSESVQEQDIETVVQPYATNIFLARSLIEALVPAFISLFIGSWSDKFGRRPVFLASLTGTSIGMLVLSIIAFISATYVVTPWIYLIASIPTVMGGSTCAFMAIVYCYISDATVGAAKAFRMLYSTMASALGGMVGSLVSGYLYTATNAGVVFLLSTIFMILGLIYCIFFVPESLKPEQIQTGHKIREFFRFDLVKDMVNTCINRRQNYDRLIICFAILIIFFDTFATGGDSSVIYLFVRNKFQWTLKDYSTYSSIRIGVQIVGAIAGLIIMRRHFKISIVTIVMIALACSLLESTARAAALASWVMYLGVGLGLIRGIVVPMSQTILSHVVPLTEVGKIFVLTNALVTVAPVGSSPVYTAVYNASLLTYPGAFNCISVGLYLLAFTMISIILVILRRHNNIATYHTIGA